MKAEAISRLTGGDLRGDPEREVTRVAPLEEAGPGELSFVAGTQYQSYLRTTRAGIVLVRDASADEVPETCVPVVVGDPHKALRLVLNELYPPVRPAVGIHPTAIVGEGVDVGVGVSVGPYAVIGDGCSLGNHSVIGAHAVLGNGVTVGTESHIHPGATVYDGVRIGDRTAIHSGARIGKEGFGFVWENGHQRIPQVGGCVIGSDVDIGTNVTIDRGSVGDTEIGDGTKIDNLVHIGHNVRLGKHVMIIAQVGISGSTTVGDGVVIGGQAGVGGHLEIGGGARIGAQSGVTASVPAGQTYSGYPARPHRESLRAQAQLFRLEGWTKRVEALEQRVGLSESGRKSDKGE